MSRGNMSHHTAVITVLFLLGGIAVLPVGNDVRTATQSHPTEAVNTTLVYSSSPAPTGIADYGVKNVGGNTLAYKMALSSVIGTAMLNSVNSSGAFGLWSLQLNVVMRVNTTSASYEYWLQNVFNGPWEEHSLLVHADFDSAIWNWTAPYASLNSTWISGGDGSISPWCTGSDCSGAGTGCSVTGCYSYEGGARCCNYSLPLGLRLRINVSYSGSRVNVDFSGASAVGTVPFLTRTSTYDSVTISEPDTVTGAAILVDGHKMTPGIQLGRLTYYEAEFVFAGVAGLETTAFTSMNSTIAMSYTLEDGSVMAPLSVYEFGETGEKASNLAVTPTGQLHGFQFYVGLGSANFYANYVRTPQPLDSLKASYSSSGGPLTGMTALLEYINNGTEAVAKLGTSPRTFRADAGSGWRIVTNGLPPNSTVRWAPSPARGIVSGARIIDAVYYRQFLVQLGFVITGGGTGYPSPVVVFNQLGSATSAQANSSVWMDAGTLYSYSDQLAGSTSAERWISNDTNGRVLGPGEIQATYEHQYEVTIAATGGGIVSYDFGLTTGAVTPGTSQSFYAPAGTGISLNATPASFWYEFDGWSGAGDAGSQIQETIVSPTIIKGEFSIDFAKVTGLIGVVGVGLVVGAFLIRRRSNSWGSPRPLSPS
jgi:thermopsin